MRGIRPALLGIALAGMAAAAPSKPAKSVLPFIHDDYSQALSAARARKVPIFIEASAPW
jgi:hypothetical protein